jgi:hypothetical protein
MSFSWSNDLETALQRISETATGTAPLHVYRVGGRIALALPSDPEVVKMVLDLYRPQRFKGKLFKLAATLLSQKGPRFGSYHHQPSTKILPHISWMHEAAREGSLGFLGCNPTHGLRCIIAGIDPTSGETFIAKLGFGESADTVRKEHAAIMNLYERLPGVIRPIGHESCDDWFLLRLPYLGNNSPSSMDPPAIKKLLCSWIYKETVRIDSLKPMSDIIHRAQVDRELSGWHQKIGALEVSRALVHGDFAVWNLRNTNKGLFAIDWEWAEPNGIAGIDLIHGLRQEASMVRKFKPEAAIQWMLEQLKSKAWTPYLKKSGWDNHLLDLLRIGLLNSHFNAKNDSSGLLAEIGIHVGH